MSKVKQINIYFMVFTLIFLQFFPLQISGASEVESEEQTKEKAVLFAEDIGGSVKLFNTSEAKEILVRAPDDTEVIVLKEGTEITYVQYVNEETSEIWFGYVDNERLIDLSEAEQFREERNLHRDNAVKEKTEIEEGTGNFKNPEVIRESEAEFQSSDETNIEDNREIEQDVDTTVEENGLSISPVSRTVSIQEYQGIALKDPTNVYSGISTSSDVLKRYTKGSILKFRSHSSGWYAATVLVNGEWTTGYINKNDVENKVTSPERLEGIGLKSPTNVYSKASRDSGVLKSYNQGHILKYQTFTSEWYEATVSVNGEWTTGYINKNDVENKVTSPERLEGIGLKSPTNVYSRASRDSGVLKSYNQGHILKYQTFTSEWYEATVSINGKWATGYIHANDVEKIKETPENFEGIALKIPTNVFSRASRNSSVLKSYNQGHILKYQTFTSEWYKATVTVNGEWATGYIHKSDVETVEGSPLNLQGIGLKSPTKVYARPDTSSSVLKSYNQGHILKYRSYISGWYEATVSVSGEWRTGYIRANDVEIIDRNPVTLDGIGLKSPTKVYARPDTSSSALRSYNQGDLLKYRTFTSEWHEATVFINGEATTGYISAADVTNIDGSNIQGIGLKSPTKVYSRPNTSSSVLKSYNQGHILKYRSYISGWYKANVLVDGEWRTGYIRATDVDNILPIQESLNGLAIKNRVNVYSRASRSAPVLKSYSKGSTLKFRTFTSGWYEATVYINGRARTGYIHRSDVDDHLINYQHYAYTFKELIDIQMTRTPKANGSGTVLAGRNLVEYYANPANFSINSSSFYQFLVLSRPTGVNAAEVNQKVLKNKGSLDGTAQAFIDAGRQHNVNEVYLMAHALHETGNGSSTLARGVTVKGRTVYNMYGIGANDGCAVECGAQRAYDEGWFTPRAAIIGGAKFIAEKYIASGQDTLYKMRWNPDSPGNHQYATHVAWAVLQTNRIASIYNMIDNYNIAYVVPKFINQPASTGSTPPENLIEYPSNIIGRTTANNLNFRTQPNTSSNIIRTLPNNTKVDVLGENGFGWYRVRVGSQTGWLSGDYVNVINLLEVTATSLNVRSGPSTSHSIIGSVSYLARGVLTSNNQLQKQNGWYRIYYGNTMGWVSGTYVREK